MSPATTKPAGTLSANMRRTLLAAVKGAAKTKARSDRMFENAMLAALKHGITQTDVAGAAGVSQAHVSRTLAAARKAARAAKKGSGDGTL